MVRAHKNLMHAHINMLDIRQVFEHVQQHQVMSLVSELVGQELVSFESSITASIAIHLVRSLDMRNVKSALFAHCLCAQRGRVRTNSTPPTDIQGIHRRLTVLQVPLILTVLQVPLQCCTCL